MRISHRLQTSVCLGTLLSSVVVAAAVNPVGSFTFTSALLIVASLHIAIGEGENAPHDV